MLELRGLTQEESVEQRSGVDRRGGFVVTPLECGLELDHIHSNNVGVEPNGVALGQKRGLGQRFSEDVGRDLEQVTSAIDIALGPQRRDQAVTREPLTWRQSKYSEQRHPVPLGGASRHRPPVGLERWAPKEPKMEDRLGFQAVYPADTACSPPIRIPRHVTAAHPAVRAWVFAERQTYIDGEDYVMVRRFTRLAALLAVGPIAVSGCSRDQDVPVGVTTVRLAVVPGAEHGGMPFRTEMTQEVWHAPNPRDYAGDPDGTGSALITVNRGQQEVCWHLTVANIVLPASSAHIHAAAPFAQGPIRVTLSPPGTGGESSGCQSPPDVDWAIVEAIVANPGDYYVNVHNSVYPPGAVRGQLRQ